uniref:Uncharacterized protein n=1 Tax=Ciona savignyi TaxID=51511 RepID=H2Z155_CIOSA
MSNLNTEIINNALSSVVGFSLDDIAKIQPFKDSYSIAWFVIFMSFIGMFAVLFGIAFLYSVCDCVCSCCRRSNSSPKGRSNKVKNGNDMELHLNSIMPYTTLIRCYCILIYHGYFFTHDQLYIVIFIAYFSLSF